MPVPDAIRQFSLSVETATESVGTLAELTVSSVLCFHGGAIDAGTETIADIHDNLTAGTE